jgi:ribosome-binding factor A
MPIRIERLKEMIREEAAELILHGISDPRLGFCTVTKVDLTNDLAYCKIHVSVLGGEAAKSRTLHALNDARGLIQAHIARRMKTRTTPHVSVELDESIERSFAIMEKIKEARASDSDGGKGEAEPEKPEESDLPDESAGPV